MFRRLRQWFSSRHRLANNKRRLERIAQEAGASRSLAKRIAVLYFGGVHMK